VNKYHCFEECVPRQIALELERKYTKYLSKKPKATEGYKLLESDDEEEDAITDGKGKANGEKGERLTPNKQKANDFLTHDVDYDSDMEI
jgi:hypothetical protein